MVLIHPATFSPQALTASQSIVPIHSWIRFTGALKLSDGNSLDRRCLGLIPAMAALVRAYAGDPRKPVWVQEYGASEEWMKAETIPEFLERSMRSAIAGGVAWFTCWASHDIDHKFDVNPLEYSLGLIDIHQNIKPAQPSLCLVDSNGKCLRVGHVHLNGYRSRFVGKRTRLRHALII